MPRSFLQPGRNCWRIEHACRFRLLIDGEEYFRAVRAAISAATHTVFILGWDFDSRTVLVPEGANDGFAEPLWGFLHDILLHRPELHIYVLNWDFAVLYALERERPPVSRPDGRGHSRLSFVMDDRHPVGSSHHQKVVVVDDAIAFVGGLDLTRSRWDTPEHLCAHPLRRDPDGKPYSPFHDVQAMVDGDVARVLGELARTRWMQATGENVPWQPEPGAAPWPPSFTADLTDIAIGISRTAPAYNGRPAIHEIRQLHLDAIAGASQYLFFENQYFTSGVIGKALAARLGADDGPEVMVISPQTQSGWLEEATMGVLRARLHRRLKEADSHGRYRLYCPHVPGLEQACLNVHSKVFTADDWLFVVGSANLSNRSMAFDTECNLVIAAEEGSPDQARIVDGIARMRSRLLAEHLGVPVEAVLAETARSGSLHETAAALGQNERRLKPLDPALSPELDALVPEQAVFDPERPIAPDDMVAKLVPKDAHRPVPRRLIGLGSLAILLAVLAVAWRWTPLGEWINLPRLVALARSFDNVPFTPLIVVASFVVGGCLMVPVMLLIAVTGIVFGPVYGTLYALCGTLLSAAVTYLIGRWLGRDIVRNLLGQRINRLSRRIARRGILAMTIIRVLPVAPFTVVNVIAGASHIRFRDYLIGTLLGMAPGILITVTFVHHLAEAVRKPSMETIGVLGAVALFLMGAAMLLQRLFAGKGEAETR